MMDSLHVGFTSYTTELARELSHAFEKLGVHAQFPVFGSSFPYPPPVTPQEHAVDGDDTTT